MKKKLTIDEQIEDLKKKGVTFEIMCEEDAKKFLRYNNYYIQKTETKDYMDYRRLFSIHYNKRNDNQYYAK